MKSISKFQFAFCALLVPLFLTSCNSNGIGGNPTLQVNVSEAPTSQISSIKDSLSWGYGQQLAQLVLQGEYVDTALNRDLVAEAFIYTLKGGTRNLLTDEVALEIYKYAYLNQATQIQSKAQAKAEDVEKRQQACFDNLLKTNPNVKSQKLGDMKFYYEVVKPGKGPKARYAQRIRFDYRSFDLFSGQPIDQTYGNREPIVHVVGNPMFPGLIEAFQLMNAGSVYRFYFPYQLAFGSQGSGGVVPPYTPVIYEIELHELYDN